MTAGKPIGLRHGCWTDSIAAARVGAVAATFPALLQAGRDLRAFLVLPAGTDDGPATKEHRAHRSGLRRGGANTPGVSRLLGLKPCAAESMALASCGRPRPARRHRRDRRHRPSQAGGQDAGRDAAVRRPVGQDRQRRGGPAPAVHGPAVDAVPGLGALEGCTYQSLIRHGLCVRVAMCFLAEQTARLRGEQCADHVRAGGRGGFDAGGEDVESGLAELAGTDPALRPSPAPQCRRL